MTALKRVKDYIHRWLTDRWYAYQVEGLTLQARRDARRIRDLESVTSALREWSQVHDVDVTRLDNLQEQVRDCRAAVGRVNAIGESLGAIAQQARDLAKEAHRQQGAVFNKAVYHEARFAKLEKRVEALETKKRRGRKRA